MLPGASAILLLPLVVGGGSALLKATMETAALVKQHYKVKFMVWGQFAFLLFLAQCFASSVTPSSGW